MKNFYQEPDFEISMIADIITDEIEGPSNESDVELG